MSTEAPESPLVEIAKAYLIKPNDPKEAAFLAPAKEDVAGFTCHAFSRARKGYVFSTGNELCNAQKHMEAYKAAHPDWKNELAKEAGVAERDDRLKQAAQIEDPDARAGAINAVNTDYEGALDWTLMSTAVPEFIFHLTALAYLCVSTPVELSKLIGKPKEYFHEQVQTWAETLSDDQWDKLTNRAFLELVESNIGNDWKVKEEKGGTPGAPATKN